LHENHKIDAQEAKKMKKEETKQFIRWCILGAVGCGFMAAGLGAVGGFLYCNQHGLFSVKV